MTRGFISVVCETNLTLYFDLYMIVKESLIYLDRP
jgi:hypothetical protein